MLSDKDFASGDSIAEKTDIDGLIVRLCLSNRLAAYMVCEWFVQEGTFDVIAAWPIPVEPFRGTDKVHVNALLQDCAKFPKAHCHAIAHLGMPAIIHRFRSEIHGISRAWFIPLNIDRSYYIFLGFPEMLLTEKTIPPRFIGELFTLMQAKHAAQVAASASDRMNAMERYVKEIGHDIASAVQATIAKLRNISTGLIPAEYISAEVAEAETEIMAAYRVADGLGLAIDPDYQIRDFVEFDAVEVCYKALDLHASEAQQRHISFDIRHKDQHVSLVGDPQAFEQMVGHLLSNAIKYAFGGSQVNVTLSFDHEYAFLKVMNLGIELPSGNERQKIWEFGFRGKEALSRHVNGSGIGLFTAKKIVLAHQGTITAEHDRTSKLTTFAARFPLASYLKKHRPEIFFEALAKGSAK